MAIIDSPQFFGQLKERLSIVTKAWFAQKDFTDITILQDFQESLAKSFKDQEDERDQFFGLSLREMIHEFKHQTLVLFKCLLLQPKVCQNMASMWHSNSVMPKVLPLTVIDALFRIKLRTALHDAIFTDLPDTWLDTQPAGLC